jgi:predicted nucleotidyltransferase
MPVRSLNSSVLKWPDRKEVDQAVRKWADTELKKHPEVCLVGYIGSYARGDWGVGSDLDLIVILEKSSEPFERRTLSWDVRKLPVPCDMLVYAKKEWEDLGRKGDRFYRTVMADAVWIYRKECA